MRNFFRTFFSVKRLAQKIDRFVDYFHCPLEDEVDNWWERKFRHPQTRSTSMVLFIYSQIYPFHTYTNNSNYFVLWYFRWLILNFQNLTELPAYVHNGKFPKKFWFSTTTASASCFWRRSTMLFVMLNFPILILPHIIIVWFEKNKTCVFMRYQISMQCQMIFSSSPLWGLFCSRKVLVI